MHLKLADAVTKQVSDDVDVNLRVKNYSVIKSKLADMAADIQLTQGAKDAMAQLSAIPRIHTVDLAFSGTATLDKITNELGKLTAVQIDASGVDYMMLETKAAEAGTRAAVSAASSFAQAWRKATQELKLSLDVTAKIGQIEAPASTPTIGVRAQTQQVAHEAAQQTVRKSSASRRPRRCPEGASRWWPPSPQGQSTQAGQPSPGREPHQWGPAGQQRRAQPFTPRGDPRREEKRAGPGPRCGLRPRHRAQRRQADQPAHLQPVCQHAQKRLHQG